MASDGDWLVEHRFRAVQEVLAGQPVTEVAARFGVSRQSVYTWRARYADAGLAGLRDASRRPHTSPARLAADVEARICEMRRTHRRWGARRICFELSRAGGEAPSRATVHRVLVRNGFVDAQAQRHKRKYKRWQREASMQLWQLDIVDGMRLTNGRGCKIVTGIDDHSRYAVIAEVVARPTGGAVCRAFTTALDRHGEPDEVLTDNGKQFTGRFTRPMPAEVLFERICRTRGIDQRFTKIKSPTTTGKIERFHRSLQEEFLDNCDTFADLSSAQRALHGWVHAYNYERPHQALEMATPATRFVASQPPDQPPTPTVRHQPTPLASDCVTAAAAPLTAAMELHLLVPPSGTVSLAGAQGVWIGRPFAGQTVHIWADQRSIHISHAGAHLKTVASRLTSTHLQHLSARGAQPAGPPPAAPALRPGQPVGIHAIEVHRTVDRNGVIHLAGQHVTLGANVAGQRVTLRLDGHLMHVIAAGALIRTLPAPIPTEERGHLLGAQHTSTPLPAPQPGPITVHRRVPTDGVVMVARQRLRVGRTHAGKTVTINVEDTHYRIIYNGEELSTHPRTNTGPIRVTKAHLPHQRKRSTQSNMS